MARSRREQKEQLKQAIQSQSEGPASTSSPPASSPAQLANSPAQPESSSAPPASTPSELASTSAQPANSPAQLATAPTQPASTRSFSEDPSPFSGRPALSPDSSAYRELVAIAAYYRAERRGFAPGGEVEDWINAEREVAGQLNEQRPS